MRRTMKLLPEISENEMIYVDELIIDMSDEDANLYATLYRSKRRDPQILLILTLLGFIGVAGVQRFYLHQILMGLLYFFTAGLCFIGTIYDLFTYKDLANEYNQQVAREVYGMVKRK